MGGRLLGGPTMVGRTLNWRDELGRWPKPFLDRLGHKARRQMCPLYVSGLIGPGDRKSIQPMARRLAINCTTSLRRGLGSNACETELLFQADRLVGGSDAVLVIHDTAIAKKSTHSVGVATEYASAPGKTANSQIPAEDHAGPAGMRPRSADESCWFSSRRSAAQTLLDRMPNFALMCMAFTSTMHYALPHQCSTSHVIVPTPPGSGGLRRR